MLLKIKTAISLFVLTGDIANAEISHILGTTLSMEILRLPILKQRKLLRLGSFSGPMLPYPRVKVSPRHAEKICCHCL
jgi:hypothetical protein